MNSISLQIFSVIGVIVYFVLIVFFLKQKSLSLKYTLTWLSLGIIMFALAIIPNIVEFVAVFLGIETPVNALFAILFFLMLSIMISLTAIVSKQGERIRAMVQNIALLEKRVRELENEGRKKYA